MALYGAYAADDVSAGVGGAVGHAESGEIPVGVRRDRGATAAHVRVRDSVHLHRHAT